MKIEIKKNEKDKLVFTIEDETHTFLQLLKYFLLKNKAEYCGYYIEHPSDNKAIFIVKGKDVKNIIKKTVEDAIKELEEIKENLPSIKV